MPSPNLKHYQEFEYDFDAVGGLQGTFDLGVLPVGAIVTAVHSLAETLAVSAGTPSFILGDAGDDNRLVATFDPEGVAAGDTQAGPDPATYGNQVGAGNETVTLTLGGADLTAGKMRFMVEYVLPSSASAA